MKTVFERISLISSLIEFESISIFLIKSGISLRLSGETIFPIFSLIAISIGSEEILSNSVFRIFFGTSMNIIGFSNTNAYSNEIPDQSEIKHFEL